MLSNYFLEQCQRVCSNAVMDPVVTALKKLRERLDESQQAFANRLGLSVRAIANYESGRRPSRAVLFNLTILASQHGLRDLSDVFRAAYAEAMHGVLGPTNDEETAWVRM